MKRLMYAVLALAAFAFAADVSATAPKINDIPDIIVGKNGADYVAVDILDLTNLASDDQTAAGDLNWGFTITGTPKYRINGIDSSAPAATVAKPINKSVENGEINTDGKAATITVRNISPSAGTTGIVDSQVVTFYVSDGDLVSDNNPSVMFYTDLGGTSRLYDSDETPVGTVTFSDGAHDWAGTNDVESPDKASTAQNERGLCITSAVQNGGEAMWKGAPIPITAKVAYRLTLNVNRTNETAPESIPYWDFILADEDQWVFSVDTFFLGHRTGTNAAKPFADGGKVFTMWWTPSTVNLPSWADYYKWSADVRKMTPQFRVLDKPDAQGNPALMELRGGSVCMYNFTYDRFDVDSLSKVSASSKSWTGSELTSAFKLNDPAGGSVLTVSGNNLKIMPSAPNIDLYSNVLPDTYDIPWEDNVLYRLSVTLSCPELATSADTDGQGANKRPPYAYLWLGLEPPNYEMMSESFVNLVKRDPNTSAATRVCVASPIATPQDYVMYLWSGDRTGASSTPASFRPRIAFGNASNSPLGAGNSILISGVKVDKITLPFQ